MLPYELNFPLKIEGRKNIFLHPLYRHHFQVSPIIFWV